MSEKQQDNSLQKQVEKTNKAAINAQLAAVEREERAALQAAARHATARFIQQRGCGGRQAGGRGCGIQRLPNQPAQQKQPAQRGRGGKQPAR